MENFLLDYVQMMAENKGVTLNKDQLCKVVNNLIDNEVIWDVLDEHVNYELEEVESNG